MRKKRPRILVVNDDGIHGEGLAPLIAALSEIGEVKAVVPEIERSAESHSLTLHKPLRVRQVRDGVSIVNGTPAACTRFGVLKLMNRRVDLIASGINRGYNLGQDVVYSGTVAAAMEGTLLDVPSFAISRGYSEEGDYAAAAAFACKLAAQILRRRLPPGVCLSVNVPAVEAGRIRGVKVARLGKRVYDKRVTMRSDPSGNTYFWLLGKKVRGILSPGTDVAAIEQRCIAVTPLCIDNTHEAFLRRLRDWDF
ncbi:MAG: 5'/3'-nucleotidase SurE [Elusimicrobia bacterium]|nr:5'/3'-nucleotidase SurE [Elusimicrobiota bacterium]